MVFYQEKFAREYYILVNYSLLLGNLGMGLAEVVEISQVSN